jgi:hypothetical protein
MKILRLFILILAFGLTQSACYRATRSFSDTTPIPYDIQVPRLVTRDEKYALVVVTEPNTTCYAGVSFWNTEDDWVFSELSSQRANDAGRCEWEWEVPTNAKDGVAEIRGYVENHEQSTGFIPKTFCIVKCQ